MKRVGWSGLDSSESEYRPVVGCCQHVNEPFAYIICEEFLDHLRSLRIRLVLALCIITPLSLAGNYRILSWLYNRHVTLKHWKV